MDTRDNVSYPDLAEGENGTLFIIYDRERDNRLLLDRKKWVLKAVKEILISKISVCDIYNGYIGENSFVAKVISKAEIDIVEK